MENIVRKHCKERRNCLLQAISPVSHNVYHSYIALARQNAALFGTGLMSPRKVSTQVSLRSLMFALTIVFTNFMHMQLSEMSTR